MSRQSIALQLWTVRAALEADADRALAEVKAAGFDAVELAPLPPAMTLQRLVELLTRHELDVVSVHSDLPTASTIGDLVELTRACRCSKLIWHGWPRDPRFDSLTGVEELIDACNAAAGLVRDHGLAFGLHNHWWEFEPLAGDQPIRLLNEEIHPDTFWQLDVYWAQTGGADPAEVARELGTRVRSIHWKDGPCVHGRPMTALGEGMVDVPRVLRSLNRPTDWVIELDECATDPLDAARRSRISLEGLVS